MLQLIRYLYIIINNIELLNHNCLNALLKIVEEPTKKNYFIFIHNRNKELLKTIRSRSIELKIFLSNSDRRYIIENLLEESACNIGILVL